MDDYCTIANFQVEANSYYDTGWDSMGIKSEITRPSSFLILQASLPVLLGVIMESLADLLLPSVAGLIYHLRVDN